MFVCFLLLSLFYACNNYIFPKTRGNKTILHPLSCKLKFLPRNNESETPVYLSACWTSYNLCSYLDSSKTYLKQDNKMCICYVPYNNMHKVRFIEIFQVLSSNSFKYSMSEDVYGALNDFDTLLVQYINVWQWSHNSKSQINPLKNIELKSYQNYSLMKVKLYPPLFWLRSGSREASLILLYWYLDSVSKILTASGSLWSYLSFKALKKKTVKLSWADKKSHVFDEMNNYQNQ